MAEAIVCLDSGVWIKFLVAEEPATLSEAAMRLVSRAIVDDRLVAPPFAGAEVGSVLRKKARQGLMQSRQAEDLWAGFSELPIEYVDSPTIRARSREIARRCRLPTLDDAAFLACAELFDATSNAERQFWTTDRELVRGLAPDRPPYVHVLGEPSVETV